MRGISAGWALLMLTGWVTGSEVNEGDATKTLKSYLRPRTITLLEKADKVKIYRLDPRDRVDRLRDKSDQAVKDELAGPPPKRKRTTYMGGYIVTAKGRALEEEAAAKLKEILLDPKTYDRPDKPYRGIEPELACRYSSRSGWVRLLICFKGANVLLTAQQADGKKVEHKLLPLDGRYADLVRLAKEAFPEDARIQALKEKP